MRQLVKVMGEEGLMNISDTVELVLKNKDQRTVLSIAPEQSVYEAVGKSGPLT